MRWREGHVRGFALAAILADERALSTYAAHVDHTLLDRATALLASIRAAADKRAALRALVHAVHGGAHHDTPARGLRRGCDAANEARHAHELGRLVGRVRRDAEQPK